MNPNFIRTSSLFNFYILYVSQSRLFTIYEDVSKGVVIVESNTLCKITRLGTIKIIIFNRAIKTLNDVKHALDLKRNLISLNTLDLKGYRGTSEGKVLKVNRGALIMMKGQ